MELINSMEPTIGKPYLFIFIAKDVWDVIHKCYSNLKNSSQIYDLKTQLWQFKQGDKRSQHITT
uniref:Retrovirus-related Pol polyprotein from transposon TNT 1-94 n=1 Tax=Cajanus cajan TaxID=3821 RepID=A0A151S3Q2_CAJCA|nr:hypothetical protein KK1_028904 [Cajanus cajan]